MEQEESFNRPTMLKLERENPLEQKRSMTDVVFVILLPAMFLTWLVLVINVLLTGEVASPDPSGELNDTLKLMPGFRDYRNNLFIFDAYYGSGFHAAPISCLGIAIVGVGFYLYLLRKHPRVCTIIGFIHTLAYVIGGIIYIVKIAIDEEKTEPLRIFLDAMLPIVKWIFIVVYLTIALCCIMIGPAKISEIAHIMSNIYKIFFSNLEAIFFGIILLAFENILISISVHAFLTKDNGPQPVGILFCAIYLYCVIAYYGRAVISLMVATWYSFENKEDIPRHLIFRCMRIIARYHLGTIAFNATYVLPVCVSYVTAYNSKTNKSRFQRFVSIFFFPYLIFYYVNYPIAAMSIYGKNFYHSSKKVFNTLMQNSALSFAFIFIHDMTLYFVTFLIACGVSLPFIIVTLMNASDDLQSQLLNSVFGFFLLILLPITTITASIQDANLLCMMRKEDPRKRTYLVLPVDNV